MSQALACGGLLIGLSVFQVEFDFGVQQFRLGFQPMLMIAAGVFGCVVARLWAGAGGALIAVAGLVGATLGAWGESLWVAQVFHIPWPASMWPTLLAIGIPIGVTVGLTAGLFVRCLQPRPLPSPLVRRSIVVAVTACTLALLNISVPQNATARVTLSEAGEVDGFRMVTADVQIEPADLVGEDPEWVTILAWRGGGETLRGLVVDRLDRVGPGHYVSTRPMPVSGGWKTVLRV